MKTFFFLLLFVPTAFFVRDPVAEWLVPKTHDFGDIPQGQPVDYFFRFKNISDEPFVIDNIRTTCGCTAPDWSEAPIESDSTSLIKITYDARKTGYFRKKIRVFFSSQRKVELLAIEGYVLEP